MIKLISLLFFGLMLLNVHTAVAKEQPNVQQNNSKYTYDVNDNYNFDENAYYINDEQSKASQDIDKIEDDSTFDTKIINSSHFSSGTATKTYIPLNKNK